MASGLMGKPRVGLEAVDNERGEEGGIALVFDLVMGQDDGMNRCKRDGGGSQKLR